MNGALDLLNDLLRHPGWVSIAIAFVAYVALSLAMLPVWPVTSLLGSVYGIWLGFLIAWPASIVAALVVFVLGQSVLRDWARRNMSGSAKLEAITRVVGDHTGWIAFLLRVSPVVPYNFINYALSITDMPFGVYVVTTTAGILPATLMWLYLGAATAAVARHATMSNVELAMYIAGLGATVLAVWLISRAVRKSLDAELLQRS